MTEKKYIYKLPNYCPDCNSVVETGVLFTYSYDVRHIDELHQEGTSVVLCKCLNCEKPILFQEHYQDIEGYSNTWDKIQLYPDKESIALKNAPEIVNNPFREAVKCYRAQAYDACAIMCRKGIEAICEDKGEAKGPLAQRIKNLKDKNVLENTFYNWTNELRIIGNDGAHSHNQKIDKQDAKDSLDFFEALITYLYHLVDQYDKLKVRRQGNQPLNKEGGK